MSKKPFVTKEQVEEIVKTYPTPFHLYDEKGIRENAKALKEAFAWNPGYKEYFAVKATPNPFLLQILKEYGCGCDCSSYTELLMSDAVGIDGHDIMFSSNDTPEEDFKLADKLGAIINLDDITHIDFLEKTIGHIPETISCRYNPGGIFKISNDIMDNPGDSKYGMTTEQITEAFKTLKAKGAKEFGIHAFLASNTVTNDYYPMLAKVLFEQAVRLQKETGVHIKFINLSGGIGIPYTPDQEPNDIRVIGEGVRKVYEEVLVPAGMGDVAIYTELGRFMMGPYGCLVTKAINEKDADFIYCDEATFKSPDINKMITMHFKPDYAIDNLRANNYICHFSVFSRELLDGTELFRTKFDGSQDHDMILRLTDNAKHIVHVPKLLYYWRSHAGSVAGNIEAKPYVVEAARGAVADHLRRHGFKNFTITSTRAFETIFKISYEIIGEPKISIIIPNKDHVEDLRRCISSIVEKSTWENYEIIVVENNSETKEIFSYYDELQNNPQIRVVTFEGKFNYSKINNFGVSLATGDYVLLLNNDTQVITINWMEELLMYAQRPDVGAVGGKLYYGDKTIQHAGVVIGLGAHRTAGHVHYRQKRENLGYMGRLCYAQDMTAVTGACLLVKKSLYEQVGGLDESFEISLNDVDFCLKLRKAGYLNVFTPFAELYHFESISRGLDDQGEKAKRYNEESERFRNKWKAELEAGDPYFNPNFSLDKSDFSLRV